MDINQILQHAINLIEAGEKDEGRDLLKQAILADPENPHAWFVYAQYCGKREQAIDSLRRVLMIDPYYPKARELLEKISPPSVPTPALRPQPQSPNETPEASHTPPNPKNNGKKKSTAIPRWFIYAGLGMAVCLCLGLSVPFAAFMLNSPTGSSALPAATSVQFAEFSTPVVTNLPPATATQFVYQSPTPTPDPCTCEAVNAYMEKFVPRLDRMLSEIDSVNTRLNKNSFTPQDAVVAAQNAARLYQDQHAETAPYCVDGFQKDAMQMFWTWEQTTKSISEQDVNGALGFINVITDDSKQIKKKIDTLFEHPKLQGCTPTYPTPVVPAKK